MCRLAGRLATLADGMARLLLIANPAASGFTGALHREVVTILGRSYDVAPIWPDSAEQARQAAAHAAEDDYDVVAAMGGDGVVHYVANGLAGTDVPLGLIPVGTTNVLARILGIPGRPRPAARRLAEVAAASPVDLAHIAFEDAAGERRPVFAMFAFGVGFDAAVVEAAEKRPDRKLYFGGLYYARSALATANRFRGKPPTLRVEAEGHCADAVAVMAQVHDTYTYLGPKALGVGPGSPDGLTGLVLPRVDFRLAAAVLPRLLAGRSLDGARGAEVWTGVSKLVVEADPPARLQADGELLGVASAVEVSPAPRVLWVAGLEENSAA